MLVLPLDWFNQHNYCFSNVSVALIDILRLTASNALRPQQFYGRGKWNRSPLFLYSDIMSPCPMLLLMLTNEKFRLFLLLFDHFCQLFPYISLFMLKIIWVSSDHPALQSLVNKAPLYLFSTFLISIFDWNS